jgi:integrase/recombinase XerD
MTSSTPFVSPLRQRMVDDMRMRKLSPKTHIGYIRSVWQLAVYLKRSPNTATVEDLRLYQRYMINHGTSAVSINNALSGLKFLFEHTLDHPELVRKMQSERVPHKLPVVLSRDEVARLLAASGNLKHITALSVAYGAGLRVSEVYALKVSDVDSQRMALRIGQCKGS